MDKDLENILKKANKGNKPEEKEEPKKVFPPNGPYDHLVFTQLVPFSGFNKILFLLILPTAMCVGFFFPGFRFATVLSLITYAGLLVIYNIINYFRFQSFKGWEERLPFKLIGWREMIHKKKMFCDLCWTDTRITIEHEEGDPVIKELIQAALTLYCKQTEKAFYDEDFGGATRSRNYWKIISYNTAEGSASPEVMRYMKQLFEKELRIIAEKTGKIQSVKIELLSEEFQIKIRVNTGD